MHGGRDGMIGELEIKTGSLLGLGSGPGVRLLSREPRERVDLKLEPFMVTAPPHSF